MPPHWLQAGPRSRPIMRTGTTGGVSVSAVVGGLAMLPALPLGPPLPPFPPLDGPAEPPDAPDAVSSDDFLARTAGVRMPSSSCVSASRKREASQRMM